MTPKYSPILVMTPNKISKKSSYPKTMHFSESPKNIGIQNLNPKNGPSLRMYENIRAPLPLHTHTEMVLLLLALIEFAPL